jgi:hypothetical protein
MHANPGLSIMYSYTYSTNLCPHASIFCVRLCIHCISRESSPRQTWTCGQYQLGGTIAATTVISCHGQRCCFGIIIISMTRQHIITKSPLHRCISMTLGNDFTPQPTLARRCRHQHDSRAWRVFSRLAIWIRGSSPIRLGGSRSTTPSDGPTRVHSYLHRWPQLKASAVTIMLWDTSPNQLSYFLSCIFFWVNISILIYFQLVNTLF